MGTGRYAEQSIQARFTKKLNMRKKKRKEKGKRKSGKGALIYVGQALGH